MALAMLGGHSVWLTPMFRGRVSHSDTGLNTVGGVLACPWFVNDWHSLRIMPLEAVLNCFRNMEIISCFRLREDFRGWIYFRRRSVPVAHD